MSSGRYTKPMELFFVIYFVRSCRIYSQINPIKKVGLNYPFLFFLFNFKWGIQINVKAYAYVYLHSYATLHKSIIFVFPRSYSIIFYHNVCRSVVFNRCSTMITMSFGHHLIFSYVSKKKKIKVSFRKKKKRNTKH